MLPKHLDEKVAKLHLEKLGVELEELDKLIRLIILELKKKDLINQVIIDINLYFNTNKPTKL